MSVPSTTSASAGAGAGSTVRAYRAADREALIDLLVEMERHYDGDDAIDRETVALRLDDVFSQLSDTAMLVYPAGNGGLSGFLTAVRTWPGTHLNVAWWVKEVYVAEAFRGQGIGRALMAALLTQARLADGERVDITTDRTNSAAIDLYRSMGGAMTDKVLLRYDADTASPPNSNREDSHA